MRPLSVLSAALFVLTLPDSALAVTVPDELRIETIIPATCSRPAQDGDTIHVHYRGTLKSDGTEFDSSYKGGVPFTFILGIGEVIKGWDQGLLGMCVGESRRLTIPPEMAYGNRAVGPIPPQSTLIFETLLVSIDGVKTETQPVPQITDEQEGGKSTAEEQDVGKVHDHPQQPSHPVSQGSTKGPKDQNDGECRLLGPFALLVQGALGGLALLSLVYKRWRETPRRPLKIWWFDASKQVFGSGLLHLANLFMSMLSSGTLSVTAKPSNLGLSSQGLTQQPNPCSFYLLNLAIDTTIGIPILIGILRLLHRVALLTPIANPPESIKSGNYGHPPRASWWLKQSILYFIGLMGMKFCVFLLFAVLPWLAWVGDWALRWTEGNEALQITFVMLIFPLIMNAMQYYIIDSFIKDSAADDRIEHQPLATDDHESDNEGEDVPRSTRSSSDGFDADDEHRRTIKEANPTPVPVGRNRDYDPDMDGEGSSQDSSRAKELKEGPL